MTKCVDGRKLWEVGGKAGIDIREGRSKATPEVARGMADGGWEC